MIKQISIHTGSSDGFGIFIDFDPFISLFLRVFKETD